MFRSHTLSKSENALTLAMLAEAFLREDISSWKADIQKFKGNVLDAIIDDSSGLAHFALEQKYRVPRWDPRNSQEDKKYNKALLFIICEYCKECNESPIQSFFFMNHYKLRNEAIAVFQDWLVCGEEVTFEKFLSRPFEGKPDRLYLADIMRDNNSIFQSATHTFMKLAETFCMPKHEAPEAASGAVPHL